MRTTQIITVCDLDEEPVEATEEVDFELDKRKIHLDLCDDHYLQVIETFDNLIANIRTEENPKATASKPTNGLSASELRAWASENGYEIAGAGPIPREIREAYELSVVSAA
jgi:Lsr2